MEALIAHTTYRLQRARIDIDFSCRLRLYRSTAIAHNRCYTIDVAMIIELSDHESALIRGGTAATPGNQSTVRLNARDRDQDSLLIVLINDQERAKSATGSFYRYVNILNYPGEPA